jgi:hypothetical protein
VRGREAEAEQVTEPAHADGRVKAFAARSRSA